MMIETIILGVILCLWAYSQIRKEILEEKSKKSIIETEKHLKKIAENLDKPK